MVWQPAPVLYPDTELVVGNLLRAALVAEGETDVWVGRKLPATRPVRAVQVVRDGGAATNLRDQARIRFLVWDTTDLKVSALSRLVVALLPTLVGSSGVLRTEHLSGPYEIPDAAPKRYLLAQIDFAGEALS